MRNAAHISNHQLESKHAAEFLVVLTFFQVVKRDTSEHGPPGELSPLAVEIPARFEIESDVLGLVDVLAVSTNS